MTEFIHVSMGKQNLDLTKMYLCELSRSKIHSVTSSNVILYNDVKNWIFITRGLNRFWKWALQLYFIFCVIQTRRVVGLRGTSLDISFRSHRASLGKLSTHRLCTILPGLLYTPWRHRTAPKKYPRIFRLNMIQNTNF